MIYLDHAASTPLRPAAQEAWIRASAEVGNASSVHGAGQYARRSLEESRERVAALLDCEPIEVVFTSASLPGVAAAAQAGFAATVLGRAGLPPGLEELPGLPDCGTAEMCLFGDAEGRSALVDPLIGFIRDSLDLSPP